MASIVPPLVWAVLLMIALVAAWVATWAGLPGNWLMVVLIVLYAILVPASGAMALGWPTILSATLLALGGELLEFLAGLFGAARAGASRRGAVYALVGSMIGGLAGLFVGLPIPVVGPILGAVLLAGLGAMAGAMWGEHTGGRSLRESWQVGQGALVGRLLGTLAKAMAGGVVVLIAAIGLIW